mmetsp:Transcript_8661/g.25996  ORF Transcript_8661/g.25996 Transcript_8661/m.25996 type:complete len:204 (-) Transcript_8661:3337-3948(-)
MLYQYCRSSTPKKPSQSESRHRKRWCRIRREEVSLPANATAAAPRTISAKASRRRVDASANAQASLSDWRERRRRAWVSSRSNRSCTTSDPGSAASQSNDPARRPPASEEARPPLPSAMASTSLSPHDAASLAVASERRPEQRSRTCSSSSLMRSWAADSCSSALTALASAARCLLFALRSSCSACSARSSAASSLSQALSKR